MASIRKDIREYTAVCLTTYLIAYAKSIELQITRKIAVFSEFKPLSGLLAGGTKVKTRNASTHYDRAPSRESNRVLTKGKLLAFFNWNESTNHTGTSSFRQGPSCSRPISSVSTQTVWARRQTVYGSPLFQFALSRVPRSFFWRNSPTWARAASFLRFVDHTKLHTTVGRTPLDEGSARRRDLYLTTHNTHNRQTSMPFVEFFIWSLSFALSLSLCTFSVPSLSSLVPLSLLYNTQHKYLCLQRDSNPQSHSL